MLIPKIFLGISCNGLHFVDYPLMIETVITHEDVGDPFLFEQQSWTLVTTDLDGEEQREEVVFKQGEPIYFSVDENRVELSGIVELTQCAPDQGIEGRICIPCDSQAKSCDFIFALVRQGAPYPAENLTVSFSQWTTEGSSFTLDVSRL